MWDYMPTDILSHIFSFLPPHTIAQCLCTSKHWQTAAHLTTTTTTSSSSPTWLLAVPTRAQSNACFAYNHSSNRWHSLPLNFLPFPVRPIAPVGPLTLCKLANPTARLRLLVANVFTKQFRLLPQLANGLRSNAAVGVVVRSSIGPGCRFRIFVAGGTSGASYERSVEAYDSDVGEWSNIGTMPLQYAVRLTVWTPNENVHCEDGTIYWMTSARAYSIVGFDVKAETWGEVAVPRAEELEWATIVKRRNGRLGLVGGGDDGEGWVWELCEGGGWRNVGYVPRMEGESGVKCVDGGDGLWLFRQIGKRMLVGDGNEWGWSGGGESCCLPQISMKVMAIEPSLSRLTIDRHVNFYAT